MAYSELIKNFNRIRAYMRQFYIYGFKTRDGYKTKSARSYDNERRRIESWLGEYMAFRQDASGKAAFISVDSREIQHNPLYHAFKAKSFTANDITLHFYLMDILERYDGCSVSEVADIVSAEYSSHFIQAKEPDESTIRKKLKEYETLGLVKSEKDGRKLIYRKVEDTVDLKRWEEAAAFFSEMDSLGVVGSFLLDRMDHVPNYFYYKHHYILHALESEIMYELLDCISADRTAYITVFRRRKRKEIEYQIVPLKILIGAQTGRSYVYGLSLKDCKFNMYRLDSIEKVTEGDVFPNKCAIASEGDDFLKHVWYTSKNNRKQTHRLEMVLHIEPWEGHILHRLEREGKQGTIELLEDGNYKYSIDVYDPTEMRPWIRTFIGRIVSLTCSHKETEEMFYRDLQQMYEIYGGDGDAV